MRLIISPAKKMRVDLESGCACTPPFFSSGNPAAAVLAPESLLRAAPDPVGLQPVPGGRKLGTAPADGSGKRRQPRLCWPMRESSTSTWLLRFFEDGQMDWVGERVRILSGFYGALRPFDRVVPYRLEMQAKLSGTRQMVDLQEKDLYAYWGDLLYQGTRDADGVFINLASREYAKAVEKYIAPADHFITVEFCEQVDGKLKQKGTFAKMARGEMVRFLAERNAETPEAAQGFDRLGYRFSPAHSTAASYVFLREGRAN